MIREHLLQGNKQFGTLKTACGRKPIKIRTEYYCGAGLAAREKEYVRLRGLAMIHVCGQCERAWRKICRDRNQKRTPTAREPSIRDAINVRRAKDDDRG